MWHCGQRCAVMAMIAMNYCMPICCQFAAKYINIFLIVLIGTWYIYSRTTWNYAHTCPTILVPSTARMTFLVIAFNCCPELLGNILINCCWPEQTKIKSKTIKFRIEFHVCCFCFVHKLCKTNDVNKWREIPIFHRWKKNMQLWNK